MGPSLPFLSAGLQLLAVVIAFKHIRTIRFRWGWVLILAAMSLQALRRVISGMEAVRLGTGPEASDWLSLLVSLLFLAGVLGLSAFFQASREDARFREVAETREQLERERDQLRDRQEAIVLEQQEVQRRSEELARFLESVVDTADVWINTLDPDARVVLWNHAAERMSGYTREEVVGGTDIWRFLYPDEAYRAEISRKAQAILRQEEAARDLETTIRTKSGETRIISWNSRTLKNPQGGITGSLAIGRDVTELRRTEEHLQQVHAIRDIILEHNVLGIAYVEDRRLVWANPRAAALLGVPLEQFVGAPARIIYPDEATYEDIGRRAYAILSQGGIFDTRVQLRRTSGQYFWCRLVGMAIDSANPQRGSVWLAEDISKQVAAEAALAESEARFRGAFEGTQDALLLMTLDGIFDCNQRALDLFGFQHKSELLQLHPADLSPARQPDGEGSRTLAVKYIQKALREGGASFRWLHRRQDGTLFTADVLLSSFRMGRRKVIQACLRDLTERLATEAQVQAVESRFRMLFEHYADAVLLQDTASGEYLDANRTALEMLRCTREELVHAGPLSLSPERQPDGLLSEEKGKAMLKAALKKGSHRFRWVHQSIHRPPFAVDVVLTVIQSGPSPLVFATWREVED